MKKIIVFISLFSLWFPVWAQTTPVVGNISATRTVDNTMVIEYQLVKSPDVKWCDVVAFVSCDDGKTFSPSLKQVSGDIGRITSIGKKKFVWSPLKEQEVITGPSLSFKIEIVNYDGAPREMQKKAKSMGYVFATPKTQPVKQEPENQKLVTQAPVRKETVKQEPVKKEPVKQVAVKQHTYTQTTPKVKADKPKKSTNDKKYKGRLYLGASIGVYPDLSYGGMIGWSKKAGAYVKYRSNFTTLEYSYECLSTEIWATQETYLQSSYVATGGLMIRLAPWLYMYMGAGYGDRKLVYEDVNGRQALLTDYSVTGVSAEGGLIIRMGMFDISAGYNTIGFKYSSIEAGIGFLF